MNLTGYERCYLPMLRSLRPSRSQRLLDTDSPTLIKTYEKSIKQLEKQKVLLDEKLKVGRKRQPSFERAFKTALVWLTNPAVLWDTGCLADRKSLLKVLFTDNLRYDKESGFLNRPIAQPIWLCGLVGDGDTKMVGLPRLELGTCGAEELSRMLVS
ncbi:MAG: hypothetical protein VYB48_11515 [Pseudomonadota bacterium]|nr:hypothetical protein [Pseudomonadota bacterium]